MNDRDQSKIDDIFTRAVAEFIDPDNQFRQKLEKKATGRYSNDIIIKFGIDPTRPDIHLGHAVVFRKLREFQDLGCKVVFLIGDFTAQIGDPTGKSKIRPELQQKEINDNMVTFREQVGKILKTEATSFCSITNSSWFYSVEDLIFPPNSTVKIADKNDANKFIVLPADSFIGKAARYEQVNPQKEFTKKIHNITFRTFLSTLRHITYSQLIQRDLFQKRIKAGQELYMNEMMYPVLQGIDSVVLGEILKSCDLEVGGSDQTFNMLMGRDVMKVNKKEPQAVLAFKLLTGLDGEEKMSKSSDNYIAITEASPIMYGKVMSLPDNLILEYFELCTYTSTSELKEIETQLASPGVNPRDLKMRLAREIVAIYHGEKEARAAEENFVNVFSKKNVPAELPVVEAKEGEKLVEVLLSAKIIKSKTDFRRLIKEGAIRDLATDEALTDPEVPAKNDWKLKIGKKRFVSIKLN